MLALEAGRNASYLSEVFTGKKSPTLETFTSLLEAADRLSPGFADEYYLELAGRVDFNTFVRSLTLGDASTMLILLSNRISDLASQRQKVAA